MKHKSVNRKPMTVDSLPYIASVNASYPKHSGPLALRVTIRADYGHRSFCTYRGFTNLEYWFNYSEYDPEQVIEITPRVIAGLIRFALAHGWDPENSKSNVDLEADNKLVQSLMGKDA